jgi:hypothetical protein
MVSCYNGIIVTFLYNCWGSGVWGVGKWGDGRINKNSLLSCLGAAILILRFHDIKTLAPRGVNNS